MAILKKAAAFLTAVMISACFAGCSDTSYIMKADDKEIKAGIYIDYIFNEMSTQINLLYQSGVTTDFLTQKIDGQNFTDYVSEKALSYTKEHAVIDKKFDELKLSLDEETLKEINSTVSDAWEQSSENFEKQGISRESLKEVYLNSEKRQAIFDYYYAADGVEAVTEDDLISYVQDNYLRYKYLYFAKNSEDEAADQESKELRDKYLEQANGLSFEEFDDVIADYQEYQESLTSSSESDLTDELVLDDAETSDASSIDSSSESTDEDMTTDTLSSFEAEAEAESAVEVSAEELQVLDDTVSEEDTEEVDPYANEYMTNYAILDEETLESETGKMFTKIKELDVDVATAYEDDSYYYIVIKGDVNERSEEYATDSENTDSLLVQMKSEDFQKYIDEWLSKISFELNDEAIDRYTVQKVYDIQTEEN